MQKSVLDKMFFIDKVFESFDTVLDFGCANGELIKALHAFFGEYRYIGYDLSEEMIDAAKNNMQDADFYTDWDSILCNPGNTLLNISSTVHEVYSYSSEHDIKVFWDRVFNSGFKYITIRDMMVSEKEQTYCDKEMLEKVLGNEEYTDKLKDYLEIWGNIDSQHKLVHYLLKYSYTHNWNREVRENYLGLTLEQLHRLIPDNYEVTYEDHFTLPYIAWQIKKDFNIELRTPTHIKIILKKVK